MANVVRKQKSVESETLVHSNFLSDLSDRDLILACQRRSEGAFNELYKRNIHLVRSALNRMASDMPSSMMI